MDGIGRLIFEMFKGVKHQFNACTQQVLRLAAFNLESYLISRLILESRSIA